MITSQFEIKRTYYNNHTAGVLSEGKTLVGYTLEDKYRGQDLSKLKVFGQTCIPEGTYEMIVSFSNKFKKRMILLVNVPYFEGIRIHGGNSINDSLGCPLLGLGRKGKEFETVFNCKTVNENLINKVDSLSKKTKVYIKIYS